MESGDGFSGKAMARKGKKERAPLAEAMREASATEESALEEIERRPDGANEEFLGWTVSHEAARRGWAKALGRLVELGADWRRKTDVGQTALHFAAGEGRTECARLLAKADPEALEEKTKSGATALHLAMRGGHAECAKALRALGADPAERTQEGYDALGMAVSRRWAEGIRLALEWGVSPFGTGAGAGAGPLGGALEAAASKGFAEGIEAMLEGEEGGAARGEAMWRALDRALEAGHDEAGLVLLARMDLSGKEMGKALGMAVRGGAEGSARELLGRGADPDGEGEASLLDIALAAGKGRVGAALAEFGGKRRESAPPTEEIQALLSKLWTPERREAEAMVTAALERREMGAIGEAAGAPRARRKL